MNQLRRNIRIFGRQSDGVLNCVCGAFVLYRWDISRGCALVVDRDMKSDWFHHQVPCTTFAIKLNLEFLPALHARSWHSFDFIYN